MSRSGAESRRFLLLRAQNMRRHSTKSTTVVRFLVVSLTRRFLSSPQFHHSLSMMLIMNGTLTTDTFFLLSGVLLAYVFMREWHKKQSFNLANFYIHRYLR